MLVRSYSLRSGSTGVGGRHEQVGTAMAQQHLDALLVRGIASSC